MERQDFLRQKYVFLHNEFGMPYTFIANKCGVSGAYIRLWISKDRNVGEDLEVMLEALYEDLKGKVNLL